MSCVHVCHLDDYAVAATSLQLCAVEVQLARAVAAAANCTFDDLRRLHRNNDNDDDDNDDDDAVVERDMVTLCVVLPSRLSSTMLMTQTSSTATTTTMTTAMTTTSWTRSAQDHFARLLDRALARVHPPLDPLQYIHAASPHFSSHCSSSSSVATTATSTSNNNNNDNNNVIVSPAVLLRVRPTEQFARVALLLSSPSFACHAVEGVVAAPATLLPPCRDRCNDTSDDEEDSGGSTRRVATVVASSPPTRSDNNNDDDDLWRRARAAAAVHHHDNGKRSHDNSDDNDDTAAVAATRRTRSLCDVAMTCDGNDRHDATDCAEARLRWRLARCVAERLVNDVAWATKAQRLRHSNNSTAAASSLSSSQPRCAEDVSVIDVAATATTRAGERVMHCDVRGVEVRARVVAYTPRYAYVAVPHTTTTTTTTAATHGHVVCAALLCRLPHPSWLQLQQQQQQRQLQHRLRSHVGGGRDGGGNNKNNDDDDTTAHVRAVTHKRARSSSSDDNDGGGNGVCLHFADEAIWGDDSARALTVLPRHAQRSLTLRAHRVCCQRVRHACTACVRGAAAGGIDVSRSRSNNRNVNDRSAVMLWLDDVYVVSSSSGNGDNDDDVDDYNDVQALVRASCARYTRACARYLQHDSNNNSNTAVDDVDDKTRLSCASPSSSSWLCVRAQQLYNALVDTASVRFTRSSSLSSSLLSATGCHRNSSHHRRARQRQRERRAARRCDGGGAYAALPCGVPCVQTCRDAAALREACNVELKYTLTHHNNNDKSNNNDSNDKCEARWRRRGIMDAERLRHTIAGMACMHGGVVVVGVSDAGDVVGHAPGLVTAALRTTGFCPAMVKDAVTVREVRVLRPCGNGDGSSSSTDVVARMPAEWWKATATRRVASAANERSGNDADKNNDNDDDDSSSQAERVLSVVMVARGQAPCYASARHTLPYVRLCASTTPMPAIVLARRVCEALALHTLPSPSPQQPPPRPRHRRYASTRSK